MQLLIGFRLEGSSVPKLCKSTEKILNELTLLETDLKIPVHWNFSLSPLLKSFNRNLNDLIMEIKTRMKTRNDLPVPAGFRGAIHPLLFADELEKELDWCRENPWLPGFKELFGLESQIIMPIVPDLSRELECGIYSKRGFNCLGLPGRGFQPMPVRMPGKRSGNGPVTLFTYLLCSCGEYGQLRKTIRKIIVPPEKELFILFETRELESGPVKLLLDALSAGYDLKLCSLRDPGIFTGADDVEDAIEDDSETYGSSTWIREIVLADPLTRNRRLSAEDIRNKKKKNNANFRRILNILSPDQTPLSHVDQPKGHKAPGKDRVLIASMMGMVALTGKSFEANFLDGRFSGLSVRSRQVLAGRPASAYLTIEGRKYLFQTESAFSYESSERAKETGLRSAFSLQLPEENQKGRLVVDYYFNEESPELFLDFQLRYPKLDPYTVIEEVVPFELPLFELKDREKATIRSVFPDGTRCLNIISRETPLKILYGSYFEITKDGKGCSLHFCGSNSPRIGFLQFSCRPCPPGRKKYIVFVNLNGTYIPVGSGYSGAGDFSSLYSEKVENFSFKIGLIT